MPCSDYSVGVDVEEISRFPRLIKKKSFLNRVYTPAEIRYCQSKKNKAQHFAARFAAKEAVWKAFSDHLALSKKHLTHRDIGVANDRNGKPHVVLPAPFKRYEARVKLSLSHTKSVAMAMALLCGR